MLLYIEGRVRKASISLIMREIIFFLPADFYPALLALLQECMTSFKSEKFSLRKQKNDLRKKGFLGFPYVFFRKLARRNPSANNCLELDKYSEKVNLYQRVRFWKHRITRY